MTGRNIISKDLAESIRQCLGRKVKLTLKALVRYELKGDKTENRVLAFASCRLFVLMAKVPTRVDQHFHYLDIQALESKKPNQLVMTVCDRTYSYLTNGEEGNSHEIDQMLLTLATALKNIFPTVPLTHIIRKVEVEPSSRLRGIQDLEEAVGSSLGASRGSANSAVGACGGFSTQYMCMCDYHALPYREEVAWDVDNIYMAHESRQLYLHDFDYLEQKDLVAIISALEYNTWFTCLRASHTKLSQEAVQRLLHMLTKSLSLEELHLDNIAAKPEFAHKLSMSLLSNSALPLQKLDLSHNPIEDKGALHISNPIGRMSKGLAHLNLSHCGLTSKGVNLVSHSLTVNKFMNQTLTYLNLAGNSLKDDVNNLFNFLAQPNVLTTLDLSGTDCAVDALFGALLRGCTTHLATLKLSRNNFSAGGGSGGGSSGTGGVVVGGSGGKKTREMLPSFKQFFTSTLALKTVALSQCKLPPDALKNVLLGLACNESVSEVEVDLSSNHLASAGAQILESCIHGVLCLGALHLNDNGFESNLGPVVAAISRNKNIKTLSIGRNLNTIKSKHVGHVVDSLVLLLQEDDCSLETLSINDSRLKSEIHNLLNALAGNCSVRTLDISGNAMGDSGARLLAKALQINTRLQHVSLDRNCVTLQGYTDLAHALHNNYTLKFIPFPLHDVNACMRTAPERTEAVMRRIQDSLQRNLQPARCGGRAQALRLHQGYLLSGTQQQLAKLVLQGGEAARTLRRTQASSGDLPPHLQQLCSSADALIADAESSKQLVQVLQDVISRRQAAGDPIDSKLHHMAQDLHATIGAHLQDTAEAMVRAAEERCPTLLADPNAVDAIRQACASVQVPASVVQTAVVSEAGAVVVSAVGEAQLALAAAVSGQVIDGVVGALATTCRAMSGESGVTGGGGGGRKRASTGSEVGAGGGGRGSSDSSRSDVITPCQDDSSSVRSGDPSPMATPQLAGKRKSVQGRKLRPQSVVGAAESLGSVGELPSRVGQQLQHLVKQRPRRHKTRQPTKAVGALAAALPEEDPIATGVDTFFRSDASTPSTPLLLSPESEHSGRLGKYEWNSSMESFPPGGGGGGGGGNSNSVTAPPGAPGGSADSLSRSESALDSECTTAQDSPSTGALTQHDTDEEDNAVFDECSELPRRRAGTGSSSLGGALTRSSPDRSQRNTFTGLLTDGEAEALTKEEEEVRRVAGLAKIGLGYGGSIMAEMRQRQRTSVMGRDEECDGLVGSLSQHLLSSAKLRNQPAAAASNGFSKQPRSLHSPGDASEDEDCSVRSRTSVRQLAANIATRQEDVAAGGHTRLAAGGGGRPGKGGHRSPNLPPFAVPPELSTNAPPVRKPTSHLRKPPSKSRHRKVLSCIEFSSSSAEDDEGIRPSSADVVDNMKSPWAPSHMSSHNQGHNVYGKNNPMSGHNQERNVAHKKNRPMSRDDTECGVPLGTGETRDGVNGTNAGDSQVLSFSAQCNYVTRSYVTSGESCGKSGGVSEESSGTNEESSGVSEESSSVSEESYSGGGGGDTCDHNASSQRRHPPPPGAPPPPPPGGKKTFGKQGNGPALPPPSDIMAAFNKMQLKKKASNC